MIAFAVTCDWLGMTDCMVALRVWDILCACVSFESVSWNEAERKPPSSAVCVPVSSNIKPSWPDSMCTRRGQKTVNHIGDCIRRHSNPQTPQDLNIGLPLCLSSRRFLRSLEQNMVFVRAVWMCRILWHSMTRCACTPLWSAVNRARGCIGCRPGRQVLRPPVSRTATRGPPRGSQTTETASPSQPKAVGGREKRASQFHHHLLNRERECQRVHSGCALLRPSQHETLTEREVSIVTVTLCVRTLGNTAASPCNREQTSGGSLTRQTSAGVLLMYQPTSPYTS